MLQKISKKVYTKEEGRSFSVKHRPVLFFVFMALPVMLVPAARAQESNTTAVSNATKVESKIADAQNLSAVDQVTKAWEAHGQKNEELALAYAQQCIDKYGAEAARQQSSLQAMPKGGEIAAVDTLNQVATAYFIQAEAYRSQNNLEEAKKTFKMIIDKFPYAQAWDMRGWYWSVAKVSQEGLAQLEKGTVEKVQKKIDQNPTKVVLYDSGKEDIVDYLKYGEFVNPGTKEYKYIVKDQEGLSQAVGEGIYPNTTSVRWDPEFKKAMKEKRLEGTPWEFVHSADLEAAYLKWVTSSEPQGVRLFYIGMILERSGLIKEALKAYYAIIVHYPGAYGWTYFKTPWYVGQAAIGKIKYLLRRNPQLGLRLQDASIRIINGFDNNVANDTVITNPGRFVKVNGLLEKFRQKPDPASLTIKRRLGKGRVHLVQYETGDWQLLVDDKPFMIHAVTYTPTKVGQSPDNGTQGNWMEEDFNKNGKIDGPYDAFVDRNRNNAQDPDETAVGDFELMKEMGVNTIRLYHHPKTVNKQLMREMYEKYGIRVIMGDFFGKYALGSGAKWNPGTDYKNEEQKQKMMESVLGMVREFKDEPYVLFWLLGNENVYGYACNADKEPEAFYAFASEVAAKIKEIDPDHPVALCNGDVLFLDKFGKYASNVDIFGCNAYRGEFGFGSLWQQVKEEADKPAFITEYGCSGIAEGRNEEESEQLQADYHAGSWEDIEENSAFCGGAGNSIGAVAFEWLDEWWKAYEPAQHDIKGNWIGPFPDGTMHEEWLGICGQGDGAQSPYLRQLRKTYYMYQKAWKK